jgi:hypothetical protein
MRVLRCRGFVPHRRMVVRRFPGCATIWSMTRVVGTRNRTEFVLDPAEALRLGSQVDAMLPRVSVTIRRGVLRAKHRELNAIDDERQLELARRLNSRRS